MCAIAFSGHLANAATELMKLDHEEPQLTEPYLSKQKKLMVSPRSQENICRNGLFIRGGNRDLRSNMIQKNRALKRGAGAV